MRRIALPMALAGVLGGCTSWTPLALLGSEPARDSMIPHGDPVALSKSVEIASPPPSPAPMLPESGIGDSAFRSEQARALGGDKDAAYRVAIMFRDGSNGVPQDERRMVRWMRHASELDNAAASYHLYLFYLARGLDRDAVRYENRALRQGYVPPPRLDPRRG